MSHAAPHRPTGLRRWGTAALAAFLLHAGGATALVYWPGAVDEESAGTLTVELAPVVMAPPLDLPKVAHGPMMQEQVATPAAPRQIAEQVDSETPRFDPSPAPEPEVALPKPVEVKEVEPEEEKQQQEVLPQEAAAQASPAPMTTAPPPIDAPPTARAAAPVAGASTAPAEARASWHKALTSHLNEFKRYPHEAEARGIQGVVTLEFTIDRSGHVLASRVAQSSGSVQLDDEALAALRRASPLPAPPDQIAGASFDLGVPFQFRLRR
jgi:protein TonB